MKLTEATEAKLDAWLAPSTWHTNHRLDMARWNAFIDQYQRDHGNSVDEADLRDLIAAKLGDELTDGLRDVIARRVGIVYTILDFLEDTGR